MRVKKYVVDTLPQAMGQIRTELGQDAMILHTKKVKTGGFLGFFGKEKIEVIAAVDTNANNVAATASYNNSVQAKAAYSSPKITTEKTENNFKQYSKEEASQKVVSKPIQEAKQEFKQDNNKRPSPDNEKYHSISSEVSEIKKMMIKMMMNPEANNVTYQKEMRKIYERLLKQGVLEDVASELIQHVVGSAGDDIENIDFLQEMKLEIINRFNANGMRREIADDVKIVHFVGPTGVGKTTTIAKIAAEKVLKRKKRIAFITADTYRIGAVDQLRTYAEILHAPIEVVFSPQDTQKAIEKLSNYDLIFMDTAGRNYHNEMYISELNNVLAKTPNSQTYLVLSLTHKFEDMVSILEQFNKVNIDKILFTKFDETLTYGSILNILTQFPYEASYITHGQNVPDDIEVFDEEKIARAILGV